MLRKLFHRLLLSILCHCNIFQTSFVNNFLINNERWLLDFPQGHELDNIYPGQCCSVCFRYCQYLLINLRIIKKKMI